MVRRYNPVWAVYARRWVPFKFGTHPKAPIMVKNRARMLKRDGEQSIREMKRRDFLRIGKSFWVLMDKYKGTML